jgi:hypothetical protein
MKIRRITDSFTAIFPFWQKFELFRFLLYTFLLLNTLSLMPVAHDAFAASGMVGSRGWNTSIPWYNQGSYGILNVLSHPYTITYPWIYRVFIAGQVVFLTTGIFRILPKLSSVMIYFFTVNLFLKGYLMFTGGEVLINILLFYMMFIHTTSKQSLRFIGGKHDETPRFSPLQNVLNNVFYRIIIIQLFVLYFFSTLYKLMDPIWLNGEALMYISQIDGFSNGWMKYLFSDNLLLSKIAVYITLAYQFLFPIVVWVKRIKAPFLIVGVILHLSISFGMGIFTFGIIMIMTYVLFLEKETVNKISRRLKIN